MSVSARGLGRTHTLTRVMMGKEDFIDDPAQSRALRTFMQGGVWGILQHLQVKDRGGGVGGGDKSSHNSFLVWF